MKRKIILASTSPRRKELLEKTGLKFEVASSNYVEDMTLPLPPAELAKFLSKGKAEAVAKNYEDAIIIAGDTFIVFQDKILGKPYTNEKAKEMLKMLSGQAHLVLSGFTIIDTKNKRTISKTVETKITFKKLSLKMINEYIKNGKPLKYAGAFTLRDIEPRGFVEKVEGDEDNVIGLPVKALMKALKEFGVEV